MRSEETADQQIETTESDHSLSKVPYNERKMGWLSITNITFGIATAIFYFQIGSVMALQFGAINALISAAYAIIVAGIMGTVIVYLSARSGMNVNLMSRGGGFGYIGASLTSLIYASNLVPKLLLVKLIEYETLLIFFCFGNNKLEIIKIIITKISTKKNCFLTFFFFIFSSILTPILI